MNSIHFNTIHYLLRVSRARASTATRIALVASFAAVMALQPITAGATAIGIEHWGGHEIDVSAGGAKGGVGTKLKIPAGQLTGGVFGDGLKVKEAGGNFVSAANICNWHINVDSIDEKNRTRRLVQGKTQSNCTRAGQQKFRIDKKVPPGRVCIRLYTAFTHRITSVCHHIHA